MKIDDFDDHLFEMSNFRKHETGLPDNVYVSSGQSNSKKLPRLKMMASQSDKMDISNTVSILIKKNITEDDIIGYAKLPSNIFKSIQQFINKNYEILIQYWNDEISTTELAQKIQKIDNHSKYE